MMVLARRLLSVVLTLALAQFGVVATAPAHAHSHGDPAHAIFAIEIHDHDHGASHADDGHHDADPTHADRDHFNADHDDGADADGAKTVVHVHFGPQFTPAAGVTAPVVVLTASPPVRPPSAAGADARTTAPPFRPPCFL